MSITKQEIPHHTPEQIRSYLTDALAIVDDLDLPDTFAEIAYGKAVDMLAAKQILLQETPAVGLGQLLTNGRGR